MNTDYQFVLNQLWQQHEAPKPASAPTHVSLFSGGGGSSLGTSAAGYRTLLAIEQDDIAVEAYQANFPGVRVSHGDIRQISAEEVRSATGLAVGELDLLDASPPCCGVSRAGRRKLRDPRNDLWKEAVRLVGALRPKVVVIENVKGMLDSDLRQVFDEMMAGFKGLDYRVRHWILDCSDYQIPQARRRLVVIGIREDVPAEPSIPSAEPVRFDVADALDGLPLLQFAPAPRGDLARIVPLMSPGEKASTYHPRGHKFNTYRLSWKKPSNTVLAFCAPTNCLLVHPDKHRGLSVDEAKRLQSFPDQYRLYGNHATRWRLLGNAVPPLLMRALARHLLRHVLTENGQMKHDNPTREE
jgi:DNA (cytosine-5)-methyltransferase 1